MEISAWVAHWACWTPTKTALRFRSEATSYEQLERRTARSAGLLKAAGTDPGDCVAYLGPSSPELVELLFACARIGAVFVPLNARMPAAELRTFLRLTEPKVFVAERKFLPTAEDAVFEGCELTEFVAGAGLDATANCDTVLADPQADATRPALVLFTSGTTGTPKGAMTTSEALMGNAADTVAALRITSADEVLTATPMFHVAGLNLLSTPALSVGATVSVHEQFSADDVLKDIDSGRSTLLTCPPPMTAELASHPAWRRTALDGLRCVVTGGTTVPETSLRPWIERGVRVVQSYGLTEAGPHVTLVPLGDVPAKAATAGKPILRAELRIVDKSGREVPRGTRGEISVRGPNVMAGYWRNPDASCEAIRDGWLRTGDLGKIDNDGYLHVIGRLKEVIVVGVSNVYPADLEAVLLESPDIRAAAVVARPDDLLGEVPVVFVVPVPGTSLTPDAVLQLFDGRLAEYKHPRQVHIIDAMPCTSVGKPDTRVLRELACAGATSERSQ